MQSFATLSHDQQVKRLQQLAQSALTAYELPETKLTPLSFTNNAIFKVEIASTQANTPAYVLRIHRPHYRDSAETISELQYVQALRREAGVAVPEPVYTRQGDLVTTASLEGVDEPRHCDLLTWLDGRVCRPHQGLGLKGTFRLGEFLGRMHLYAQDSIRHQVFACHVGMPMDSLPKHHPISLDHWKRYSHLLIEQILWK